MKSQPVALACDRLPAAPRSARRGAADGTAALGDDDLQTGDLQSLVQVLAPDVLLVVDGGGSAVAVPRPIHATEPIFRLATLAARVRQAAFQSMWLNGAPAMRIEAGEPFREHRGQRRGRGRADHEATRSPDKLTRLGEPSPLSRG